MQRQERVRPFSRPWWMVIATVIAGLAVLGFYIVVISAESNNSAIEIAPWIVLMSVAALVPLLALFSRQSVVITVSLLGCAIIFGALAAVSLGVAALPAAILAFVAYERYFWSRGSERGVGASN